MCFTSTVVGSVQAPGVAGYPLVYPAPGDALAQFRRAIPIPVRMLLEFVSFPNGNAYMEGRERLLWSPCDPAA
jgi:hypothetical protein